MITLFAIPKPFQGHNEVIQRNAITSWTLPRPRPEILLFGDDKGTAEIAQEFDVQHIPRVARNEYGTPLINDIFKKAQLLATHDVLCYVNADIILTSDFIKAVEQVARRKHRFLMVGRRWDVDLGGTWDFHQPDWEARLRAYVQRHGGLHGKTGIDYFVFPRGLFGAIPPFAIGRTAWDNWLIYRARAHGAAVIDITRTAIVVHQNHDYSHVTGGEDTAWHGPEVRENLRLAGGHANLFGLSDATHFLTTKGVKRNLSPGHLRRRLDTLPTLYPRLRPLSPCLGLLTMSANFFYRRIAG